MRVTFDQESADRHRNRVSATSSSLGQAASKVTGRDVSAGFGIMCSFLAADFVDVASAVDEALRTTRGRVDSSASALGQGVTDMAGVDDDAAAGFSHLTNAIPQ